MPSKKTEECDVGNCKNPAKCRGKCSAHYQAYMKSEKRAGTWKPLQTTTRGKGESSLERFSLTNGLKSDGLFLSDKDIPVLCTRITNEILKPFEYVIKRLIAQHEKETEELEVLQTLLANKKVVSGNLAARLKPRS